jgi:hypothetical protein
MLKALIMISALRQNLIKEKYRMELKRGLYTKMMTAVMLAALFALNGCSGSSATSSADNQQFAAKTVSISGSVDPALGKGVAKSVEAAASSIGTVTAVDVFTGATSPAVDIVNNQFSGLTFSVTSAKSVYVLVAKITNGATFRSIIPLDLSNQPTGLFLNTPLTVLIGPKSESVVQAVQTALNIQGKIGIDSSATLPPGTSFSAVSTAVTANGGGVVAYGQTGITIIGSLETIATQTQFIYTSDSHYGIKRSAFNGYSSGTQVNGALVTVMNGMPALTLNCLDGGINACKPVGAVDFVVNTGDLANRADSNVYPYKNAPAALLWDQFAYDYLTTLNLKDKVGSKAPLYLVPGNHDVSNAIGYYKAPLNSAAGIDATSYVNIFNYMMKPATALTNAAFIGATPDIATAAASYAAKRVVTSRDVNGVHLVFVGMWPDSISRPLIDADLAKVPATTPVLLFTHDQPTSEPKHFTNPLDLNPATAINSTNKFENLLSDVYANAQLSGVTFGTSTDTEQRAFVAWLKTHKNIVAYFHGNDNANEFYTYTGPDNDIALNIFRVDSPMKGNFSATDPTKLSFQVVTIDPLSQKMTVREYLWYLKQWGTSTTVSLAPRTN